MRTRLPKVGMWKGYLFSIRGYKRGTFSAKMVYKRVGGWTSAQSLPVLNFVKYPPPPLSPGNIFLGMEDFSSFWGNGITLLYLDWSREITNNKTQKLEVLSLITLEISGDYIKKCPLSLTKLQSEILCVDRCIYYFLKRLIMHTDNVAWQCDSQLALVILKYKIFSGIQGKN